MPATETDIEEVAHSVWPDVPVVVMPRSSPAFLVLLLQRQRERDREREIGRDRAYGFALDVHDAYLTTWVGSLEEGTRRLLHEFGKAQHPRRPRTANDRYHNVGVQVELLVPNVI